MATKDTNNGSSSLLSKVAKFVRNPTKDWNELDQPESEQADSGYSKQALKEMIERKRQNDFVRKREFDHLRKLRRREPTGGTEQDAGRPSFFQSSLPSNPDERATTLKKIDEIEAQMSKQWWKGKQADAGSSTNFPVSSMPGPISGDSAPASRTGSSQPAEKDSKFAITEPSTLNPELAPDMMGQEFPPTQLASSLHPVSSQLASSQMASGAPSSLGLRPGAGKPAATSTSRMSSGFSNSQLFATELGDGGTDPDLEEAAIRFANGDDAGAEAGLMEALNGAGVTPESAEVWMAALFDLYRATDQQQRFDAAGVEFSQRFGRLPPAWFSMPALVGMKGGDSTAGAKASATWTSPVTLDMMAIIDLRRAVRETPSPWKLNWSQLRTLQPDAGAELGGIFALWCQQQVALSFEGAGNLEKVLRSFARSGDKTVAQYWWQLLMDALRVMRLQDEFELVALDYCVTYEVSPPAWTDARCEYKSEGGHHPAEARMHNQFSDTQPFMEGELGKPGVGAEAALAMGGDGLAPVRLELAGEILGDASPALEKLEVERHGSERLVVSCAKLIRVDFSAAGSILNWVAQRQNEGCHIQFREVHRLVAAFFNVIGINEHARVVPRSG